MGTTCRTRDHRRDRTPSSRRGRDAQVALGLGVSNLELQPRHTRCALGCPRTRRAAGRPADPPPAWLCRGRVEPERGALASVVSDPSGQVA